METGKEMEIQTQAQTQQAICSLSRFRACFATSSFASSKSSGLARVWGSGSGGGGGSHETRTTPATWEKREKQKQTPLPRISPERLQQAAQPSQPLQPSDTDDSPNTVLYLAYGSNLAASTFLDARGIRPLAAINVLVPQLELAFDLPGIPYREPAFANTRYRRPTATTTTGHHLSNGREKEGLKRRPQWTKGLVGVVYEVTPADYVHIIATEGGGSSYRDILIPCYALPAGTAVVPERPDTRAFMAHTLFAPRDGDGDGKGGDEGRLRREDPNYAQPSARYLGLLVTGSAEHELPRDYQQWLRSLHSYRITTRRQKIGAKIFLGIWTPIIAMLFLLSAQFGDSEDGKIPTWLAVLFRIVFSGVWASYDGVFKKMYGDGERTIGDDEEQWGGRLVLEEGEREVEAEK